MKMDGEYCYSFSFFEELELTKEQLRVEFKTLREMGIVEYTRGLMNDDGMVAGSGYGLPYGREHSEKRNKLIEDYELQNGKQE